MDRTRHTLISVTVAVVIAVILVLAGLSGGQSLIIGAIGGIVASIFLQRRSPSQSSVLGDSSLDASDLDSLRQRAASVSLDIRESSARIEAESVRSLIDRLAEQFDTITRHLADPQNASAVPVIVDNLFEPAEALVTEYTWLQSRGGVAEHDRMSTIARLDMPAAEFAARQVAAILDRPGDVDIESIKRSADFTPEHDGSLDATDPATWGNRQRLVDDAERIE